MSTPQRLTDEQVELYRTRPWAAYPPVTPELIAIDLQAARLENAELRKCWSILENDWRIIKGEPNGLIIETRGGDRRHYSMPSVEELEAARKEIATLNRQLLIYEAADQEMRAGLRELRAKIEEQLGQGPEPLLDDWSSMIGAILHPNDVEPPTIDITGGVPSEEHVARMRGR